MFTPSIDCSSKIFRHDNVITISPLSEPKRDISRVTYIIDYNKNPWRDIVRECSKSSFQYIMVLALALVMFFCNGYLPISSGFRHQNPKGIGF